MTDANTPRTAYTDEERETGQRFLAVMDGSTGNGINLGRAIRAAIEAEAAASAPTPAADAMASHAFGICAVCGASVDDPEAREYCEARDEAEKARGGCYGPRPALASATTPAEPLDVERLALILAAAEGFPGQPSVKNRHLAQRIAAEYARLAASPSSEPEGK